MKKISKEVLDKLGESTRKWLQTPEAQEEISKAVEEASKYSEEQRRARIMDPLRLLRRIDI